MSDQTRVVIEKATHPTDAPVWRVVAVTPSGTLTLGTYQSHGIAVVHAARWRAELREEIGTKR